MDLSTVRRIGATVCLVGGGLGMSLGTLLEPDENTPIGPALAGLAAHHHAELAAEAWVGLLTGLLLPAVWIAAGVARRGAPRLATWGGATAFVALLAAFMSVGPVDTLVYVASGLPDKAGAGALIDGYLNLPAVGVPTLIFVIGHLVGFLLLGLALARCGDVPRWTGVLVAVSPFAHLAAMVAGLHLLDAAAFGLLVPALARVAVSLWSAGDRPPLVGLAPASRTADSVLS